MQVWITSDKRYGDSEESHWVVEVLHDPDPDASGDYWARLETRTRRFPTKEAAIEGASLMTSNVGNTATVYERALRRLEGDHFDWTFDWDATVEAECIYDEGPR